MSLCHNVLEDNFLPAQWNSINPLIECTLFFPEIIASFVLFGNSKLLLRSGPRLALKFFLATYVIDPNPDTRTGSVFGGQVNSDLPLLFVPHIMLEFLPWVKRSSRSLFYSQARLNRISVHPCNSNNGLSPGLSRRRHYAGAVSPSHSQSISGICGG